MKKKSKKTLGIVIAIISVVALITLAGFGFDFSGSDKPFAISGVNALSISQASLQSANAYLSGKVWLITFSSGGLGQRYYGSFSPNDVQSATSDSSTTTKDFSIDVQYSDQTCNYAITQTSSRKALYEIQSQSWTCLLNPSEQDVKDKTGLNNILYYGASGLKCFAYGWNSQSPVGNLNSPNLDSTFDVTINGGGKTATKTISTLSGTTQGAVGDFAYVSWAGNLVSGQSCPDKSPYIPIYVNGQWRLGRSDYYYTYLALLNVQPNGPDDQLWLNNIRSAVDNAKLSQSFGSVNSATSLDNAVVKVTLQNQIQFPVNTLYIKADTIGVYTPTPEIKLLNADSSCFQTGNQGGIVVELQNIGDEAGTWNVYAICQSPFSSTSNLQVSLQPNEKTTRIIPISAYASSEQNSQCTIYAESPAGTKQLSADVCVKPQITCTANQKFCDVSGSSEVIKQCSSNGATSSIIDICEANEKCENAECKVQTSGGEVNLLSKIGNFFKNIFDFTGGLFAVARLIFVLIVLIFVTLFSKDIISDFSDNKVLSWVLGIVLGIAFGYLAYLIFWVGILVLVVFIVIKSILRYRR